MPFLYMYDTADDTFCMTQLTTHFMTHLHAKKYTSSCALICIILFSDVCPYFTGASRTTVPVFISSGRVIWLFPARKIVPLSHRDR